LSEFSATQGPVAATAGPGSVSETLKEVSVHISPHLCFDGQCEAAFSTYHQILGGTIVTMLKYGESPMASQIEPRWHDRIAHATLQLGELELIGADLLPHDYRRPQGFLVTLTIPELVKAKQIFLSLSEGGEVRMPFQTTFWSAGFGVLIDRFSVPWEINCAQAPPAPQAGHEPM
jgi:PhnB protein